MVLRQNPLEMYDIDDHIAEIYDQSENYDDDVQLLQRLIDDQRGLNILEPFCGTSRILIPLALAGHRVTGIERAHGMLRRARAKIERLPSDVQDRITLIEADVFGADWSTGFDLVVLGGNCLYEIATPEGQAECVQRGAAALRPGGMIYVDNNHMEGPLDPAWQTTQVRRGFPSGVCADGTQVETMIRVIWFDVDNRLIQYKRHTRVTLPDGTVIERAYVQQTHPVSQGKVAAWLTANGCVIETLYGNRQGDPYTPESPRAIFWATKSAE